MSQTTDAPVPSDALAPQRWRDWLVALGWMLLAAAGVTLSHPPIGLWPLAYVSLVPLLLGIRSIRSLRGVVLAGWVTGVLFWAVNLHWLSWVTPFGVGYIAAVLYLAVYWPATAMLMRVVLRARWPVWILLPVFWVALEWARAYVISGFPWFFLAHTQWRQTTLIQIADATGVYGVSFFVAMVNGLAFEVLTWWRARRNPAGREGRRGVPIVGVVATVFVLAGLLGYGLYRRMETHGATRPGPVVAVVQRAFPISLWHDTSRMEMLEEHYHATRYELAPALDPNTGCDLVVWPETVLPSGLNREFLTMDVASLPDEDVAGHFGVDADTLSADDIERGRVNLLERQEALQGLAGHLNALARRVGCPILAGGSTIHYRPEYERPIDRWRIRNSVVLFDGNGSLPAEGVYSKMHLVPFSEYVPFRESAPTVHRALRWFVPDVMGQLDYGKEVTLFPIVGQHRRKGSEWSAASPICYEGTFGRICREMVMSDGSKQAEILLNLSNDGWFAFPTGRNEWTGSAEHPQHLAHYVFRAIETRCPVVRSVNTGVSASISSDGELLSLVSRNGDWAMVTGALLLDGRQGEASGGTVRLGPQILVDHRTTLYSVAGDGFAIVVGLSAVGAIVVLIIRGKRGSSPRNGVT